MMLSVPPLLGSPQSLSPSRAGEQEDSRASSDSVVSSTLHKHLLRTLLGKGDWLINDEMEGKNAACSEWLGISSKALPVS